MSTPQDVEGGTVTPIRTATAATQGSVATGAVATGPWMHGFHGAIVHVADAHPASLRSLALGRRSTGLGHLDDLVRLPDAPTRRHEPRSSTGHLPVAGTVLIGPTEITVEPAGETPALSAAPAEIVDPAESLEECIDRGLASARYLLLPNRGRAYAVGKRLLDLTLSSVLLTLCAPVLLALALLIRLDSPGPAIFRQTRVTRGGRTFRFYKFRTMYVDARERFPHLYDYGTAQLDNQFYKLADDPRNTRVGRWLRRTTLDELPNLLNVLLGDLSMVGPRPDLPELVRRYRPEEFACLFTKAGLTGFAQVSGRSLLTVHERLQLDLRYVSRQTLVLDLRIIWRTVVVVLSGKGAF